MRIFNVLVVSLAINFLFFGCKKNEEIKPQKIFFNSLAPDFKIPQKIFQEVKKSMGLDNKTEPEFLFTTLDVQLFSDQKSVLSYPNLVFSLQNGGGQIDLKDYVVGTGSFYLSFPAQQFLDKFNLEFIFYVSNSPKVKIRDEEYGLGCGQMLDLKSKFSDLQKINFLKVNSVDQSYVHVLAGQYIFIFKKGVQYYLTHLNITDSRYEDKLCSSIFKVK